MVRERLTMISFELAGATPEDLRQLFAGEIERYKCVGADSNLLPD